MEKQKIEEREEVGKRECRARQYILRKQAEKRWKKEVRRRIMLEVTAVVIAWLVAVIVFWL